MSECQPGYENFLSACLSIWKSFYLLECLSARVSSIVSLCFSVLSSDCLSVWVSMCLSVFVSMCLSVFVYFCLSVYVSQCLFVLVSYLSECLSVWEFFYLHECLSVYVSENDLGELEKLLFLYFTCKKRYGSSWFIFTIKHQFLTGQKFISPYIYHHFLLRTAKVWRIYGLRMEQWYTIKLGRSIVKTY